MDSDTAQDMLVASAFRDLAKNAEGHVEDLRIQISHLSKAIANGEISDVKSKLDELLRWSHERFPR